MTGTVDAEGVVALALLAHTLNRDLQRAAQAAGGPTELRRMPSVRAASLLRCPAPVVAGALAHPGVTAARARCLRDGVGVVGSADLPPLLSSLYDPPFGLFVTGAWAETAARIVSRPVVAIVGSRHPTASGVRFAESLAAELAARGAVIVSGLALGIDAAAHRGALDAGGYTVAVLGCGLGQDYPRRHAGLRRRIAERGAVVSEYWCDTEPAPWRFPARNRIVAGMSHVTVVIEARTRSGALITADFALEGGRVAMAVPGSPWAEQSQGCNELIRHGAGVCCTADDVIAEVPHAGWTTAQPAMLEVPAGPCAELYALLGREPMRADQLAGAAHITPAATAAALAELEVQGLVLRGEGQRYWAVRRAGASPGGST